VLDVGVEPEVAGDHIVAGDPAAAGQRLAPASSAAVMKLCRNECGLIRLSIPAAFANRRTIRADACRSSRCVPSWFVKIGPDVRAPM